MHEISVVQSLIELVEEQLTDAGGGRVAAVTVGIGPLSGVVPMAMQFAFDVATFGTVLQGARLNIENNPLVIWCDVCARERQPVDISQLQCPVCREPTPKIIRGTEMELLRIEVNDGERTTQNT